MALGDVYEKTGAAIWTLRSNIAGPAGGAAPVSLFQRIVTAQAIPATTSTGITWDREDADDIGIGAVPVTDLIIPGAGRYQVHARATFSANVTRWMSIYRWASGAPKLSQFGYWLDEQDGTLANMQVQATFVAAAGDVLRASLYCNSASTLTVATLDLLQL